MLRMPGHHVPQLAHLNARLPHQLAAESQRVHPDTRGAQSSHHGAIQGCRVRPHPQALIPRVQQQPAAVPARRLAGVGGVLHSFLSFLGRGEVVTRAAYHGGGGCLRKYVTHTYACLNDH